MELEQYADAAQVSIFIGPQEESKVNMLRIVFLAQNESAASIQILSPRSKFSNQQFGTVTRVFP